MTEKLPTDLAEIKKYLNEVKDDRWSVRSRWFTWLAELVARVEAAENKIEELDGKLLHSEQHRKNAGAAVLLAQEWLDEKDKKLQAAEAKATTADLGAVIRRIEDVVECPGATIQSSVESLIGKLQAAEERIRGLEYQAAALMTSEESLKIKLQDAEARVKALEAEAVEDDRRKAWKEGLKP